MTRKIALLLALAALAAAGAVGAATTGQPAGGHRLAIAFFTEALLTEVTARIEAERIDQARLTGAYLQEQTGLIWARSDNGKDLDWYAAGDYCADLEVADWTDWRLPSIEELEGLHDRRSTATYKLPPGIRLTGCCPWSATRSGDSSAWNFSFRYRKRFSGSLNLTYELRALCVRRAGEADLLFYEQAAEEQRQKKKKQKKS